MAEIPDTSFKSGCCPNATGISLPAVSARGGHPPLRLPFHHAPSAPRSEAAPHAMRKTETPAGNPKHAERRATPLATLCLLPGVERTWRSGGPTSVDNPKRYYPAFQYHNLSRYDALS